jgi:hypothetical protein
VTWNGSADNQWNNSANWTPTLPAADDEVIISANPTGIVLLDDPAIIKLLQLSDGELTVSTGLTATGSDTAPTTPNTNAATHRNAIVVNNGSTLTLGSGADVVVQTNDDKTAFLRVGYGDTVGGILNVADGASLAVGATTRYANFHIGETAGATGIVNQTGGAVTVLGSFNIGVDGGSGQYNISNGTLRIDHADDAGHTSLATLGLNLNAAGGPEASNGVLNLSGDGRVEVIAHDLTDGSTGSTAFILGNRDRGVSSYGAGDGVVNQSGGVFHVSGGAGLWLSSVGNGIYNLSGGTLEIGGDALHEKYGTGNGTYTFNFGGIAATPAMIKVIDDDLTTSVNFTLVGGVAVIDTNGQKAYLTGNLLGQGAHQADYGGNALVKAGEGTLNLSGATRTLDSFYVTAGSVDHAAGDTTAVEFAVGSGSGATGDFVMDGGSLTINASQNTSGGVVAGSFRVGDFGGTGTFTQNDGTVTIATNGSLNIGNQGGTGTYTLNDGTLTLGGGLNVIGRSQSGKAASNGTLNIAGGTLNIQDGSSLINGNNFTGAGVNYGTSTINQTGGIVHVENDSNLYISGFGSGTYNLLGGTLEIGGSSLNARYNNTTADYTFNFGGAVSAPALITVFGNDLNTSVNVSLVSGISVINTNGLSATLSGNMTGTGGRQVDYGGNSFIKVGAGTLSLSGTGTRALDSAFVVEGTTEQVSGTTTVAEFGVGSGAGTTGEFVMTGGSLTVNASQNTSGGAVAGSFRVGDFDGEGTFTQDGGTVTVTTNGSLNIGNQGGSGTYNLNGGTLTLAGGLNVIGRSQSGKLASNGTLNISGGTLNIQDNSSLINGNNFTGTGVNYGTSIITQTDGTLHVANDSRLYISGYGDGTYDLSGGTLEIGGSSLNARYNNTTSNYSLNLSGGTVRVTGADLNTNVAPTLSASSTSTIDTNGFNATFGNGINGTGDIAKVGAGTLSVTNINAGNIAINGGVLVATASINATSISINNGGRFNAVISSINAATVVHNGGILALRTGQVEFAHGLALEDGSTLIWTLDGNTNTDATKFSAALVDGGVSVVSGQAIISMQFTGNVDFNDAFWQQNRTWNILVDSSAADLSGLANQLALSYVNTRADAGSFSLNETTGVNGTIQVEWTASPVPESSTYGIICGGVLLLGLVIHRKTRRQQKLQTK